MKNTLRMTLTEEKFIELYEDFVEAEIARPLGWFENETEFDNWAGEVFYDLLTNFIEEELGIEIICSNFSSPYAKNS